MGGGFVEEKKYVQERERMADSERTGWREDMKLLDGREG